MKPLPAVAEDANALSNLSSIMLGFPDIVVWYVSLLTWPQRLQKHLHFLSFHFKNHLIKYPDKHNLILYRITPWNLSLAYQQKFVILAKKISNKTNILRKSRCIERKMSMSLFKLKGFDLQAFVSFSAKRACTYIWK